MTVASETTAIRLGSRLAHWARRVGLGRKAAIALTVAALASAIATYGALTDSPLASADPRQILILLNLDLVLFLALAAIVARRLVQVWVERRRGSVGSRLQTRMVVLFSLVALTPAIIVSVFSGLFFSLGVQAWFSERVRTALNASMSVAEAYLKEHQQTIRGDILAMANDLNRAAPLIADDPQRFRQFVATQARLRALGEATVFDSSGRILARYNNLGLSLFDEPVPLRAVEQAQLGEPVLLTSGADDRIRAIVKLDRYVDAFLYVGRFVEPGVIAHIERTKAAFAQYQKMEGQRSSIEVTFTMMFVLVALMLLMAAIWVGMVFATRLTRPISGLVSAAERVRAGDLSARVEEGAASDEIGTLARAFNRMTEQLGSQRDGLVEANRLIDERRHFMETVLEGVSSGVLGLDADGRIDLANRAAAELLGATRDALVGRALDEVMPKASELLDRARRRPSQLTEGQVVIGRQTGPQTLLVRIGAERVGERPRGYVATFDDVTELLAAQRKAAWSDVARRIAHEIKNPLTPIQLAAERLRRKYLPEIKADPDTFTACTDTIVRQVGDIGRLVDEFSSFARMPAPVMKRVDIVRLCRESMFMFVNAHRAIEFVRRLPDRPIELACDARQVSQAMTNLLKNAVEAIEGRAPQDDTPLPKGRIEVAVGSEEGRVVVSVADNGCGLPEAQRDRLTEPYFTTREKGTGLGLAIVRKIMEDHGGQLRLNDREGGGCVIRLVFAAEADAVGGEAETTPKPVEQGVHGA
jgi:two-component system nitrogen regulation sensor histidine kinase NtrY